VRHDSAWNQWLRGELAALFVDAVNAVRAGATEGRGFDIAALLAQLPLQSEILGFFKVSGCLSHGAATHTRGLTRELTHVPGNSP